MCEQNAYQKQIFDILVKESTKYSTFFSCVGVAYSPKSIYRTPIFGIESRILLIMDAEEFRKFGYAAIDFVADYLENIRDRFVYIDLARSRFSTSLSSFVI